MRMNKIRKRRYIITLILLLILGIVFFYFGFKECNEIRYSYKEENSVDYKVYLKENSFFETPYLEQNKTYITSLINYIDTLYNYKIVFNKNVSGDINYKLMAEIKADKTSSDVGNYWTKTYTLQETKTDKIENSNSHEIHISQTINYNEYNDLLNSFIKEYSLQADSSLRIYLEVTGTVKVSDTNDFMNINSDLNLTVPLSKLAIEGKIDTQSKNNEKEIIKKAEENEPYKNLFKILFIFVIILFIYKTLRYVLFLVNKDKYLSYRDRIKKINYEYEDIITKVKKININNLSIIYVEEFEDLINVYNSIKEPINFLYGNDKSQFFIIKGNSCYMYIICKEDIK